MGLMLSVLVFSVGVLEALSCLEHIRQSYLPLELRRKRRRLVLDLGTGTIRHRETRRSSEFQRDPRHLLRALGPSLQEEDTDCDELVAILESGKVHSSAIGEPNLNLLTVSDGLGGRESDGISRSSTPETVILADEDNNDVEEASIPFQPIRVEPIRPSQLNLSKEFSPYDEDRTPTDERLKSGDDSKTFTKIEVNDDIIIPHKDITSLNDSVSKSNDIYLEENVRVKPSFKVCGKVPPLQESLDNLEPLDFPNPMIHVQRENMISTPEVISVQSPFLAGDQSNGKTILKIADDLAKEENKVSRSEADIAVEIGQDKAVNREINYEEAVSRERESADKADQSPIVLSPELSTAKRAEQLTELKESLSSEHTIREVSDSAISSRSEGKSLIQEVTEIVTEWLGLGDNKSVEETGVQEVLKVGIQDTPRSKHEELAREKEVVTTSDVGHSLHTESLYEGQHNVNLSKSSDTRNIPEEAEHSSQKELLYDDQLNVSSTELTDSKSSSEDAEHSMQKELLYEDCRNVDSTKLIDTSYATKLSDNRNTPEETAFLKQDILKHDKPELVDVEIKSGHHPSNAYEEFTVANEDKVSNCTKNDNPENIPKQGKTNEVEVRQGSSKIAEETTIKEEQIYTQIEQQKDLECNNKNEMEKSKPINPLAMEKELIYIQKQCLEDEEKLDNLEKEKEKIHEKVYENIFHDVQEDTKYSNLTNVPNLPCPSDSLVDIKTLTVQTSNNDVLQECKRDVEVIDSINKGRVLKEPEGDIRVVSQTIEIPSTETKADLTPSDESILVRKSNQAIAKNSVLITEQCCIDDISKESQTISELELQKNVDDYVILSEENKISRLNQEENVPDKLTQGSNHQCPAEHELNTCTAENKTEEKIAVLLKDSQKRNGEIILKDNDDTKYIESPCNVENLDPNIEEKQSNSRRNSYKSVLHDITSELQNTDSMDEKAIKEILDVKSSLKPVVKDSSEANDEDKDINKETLLPIDRMKRNEHSEEEMTIKDNVKKEESIRNEHRIEKLKGFEEDVITLKESEPLKAGNFTAVEDISSPDKAFWLIFSGEYTKAMSKDWHSGHFCCWQCDESLTGQRYVLRDDHPYCIKCYEQVFANTCDECSKVIGIDSKDLSYKDKHWHEACFLCSKCRVSLVDKQFGSKADKIYCGNCYDAQFASRCDGCGQIFRAGTKKMEYKTRQWHEQCFCCCVCKTAIGTKSFIPREQEIYCAGCYEEKFATRCVKCNKIITSGGVTYKNEPWHRECFTCTNCSTSLAGQRFTSRDEKPYCADCFGELFAKRCTACCKPITGIGGTRFISFEDRHWHNDCFICASCRSSLVGRGFITDAEDILCTECAKQKLM